MTTGAHHDRKSEFAGFVLAGGKSSRMGRDKALLEIDRMPMISRAVRLVEAVSGATASVIGAPESYREFGFQVVADDWPGAGPLGGIATALRFTLTEWNLILACDLPHLTADWLEFLIQRAQTSAADAVLAVNDHWTEPLCAAYRKSCEPLVRDAVANGRLKVQDCVAELRRQGRLDSVEPSEWKAFDSDGTLFKNMNSPQDYEDAKARFGGRAIL
jgi:molybdopterin-guanine dinucleotide biosynthesis protein A